MEALDVTAIVNKIIAGEGGCPHCVSEVARTAELQGANAASAAINVHSNGVFDTVDEAVKAMVHPQKEFLPNEEVHKKYDYLFDFRMHSRTL